MQGSYTVSGGYEISCGRTSDDHYREQDLQHHQEAMAATLVPWIVVAYCVTVIMVTFLLKNWVDAKKALRLTDTASAKLIQETEMASATKIKITEIKAAAGYYSDTPDTPES